jgi:SAM-dependent methyltransferase
MTANFVAINSSKANFDEIYSMEDPRAYFSVLGELDYMIPDVAEPIVRQILEARIGCYGRKPRVLDLGCSYGINAAVHRFPVTFATLRRRYARREMAGLEPAELARLDCNYYAGWPDIGLATFVGHDVSESAVSYAQRVGLLDAGIVADLEQSELSADAAEIVSGVDVVLSTGCVGYVTERTFRRVLDATSGAPWIVSFVLRMFPYDTIARMLADYGLVTERFTGAVFAQRRFRDLEEFGGSLATLEKHGVDPHGFEAEGLLQAELFVSRPEQDARAAPLSEIVTVTSGRNRPMGARYVQTAVPEGRVALEP